MLKDMRISEREKKMNEIRSIIDDSPSYPHGLSIEVSAEVFEKLGLSEAPEVGKKMVLTGIVEVVRVHKESSSDDRPKYSMGLQIVQMDLGRHDEPMKAEEKLYGEK
jgi:hypothetical protein